MNELTIMVNQPTWVTAVLVYGITLLGSVVMYLFSFAKGFKGTIEVLERLFPDRRPVFYHRLDFLISIFLGAAIGTILFGPTTPVQALTAGLGWVGAVNVLLAPKVNSND